MNTKTIYILLDSDQDIVQTFPENSNFEEPARAAKRIISEF